MSGNATVTYTASTASGFCRVTVEESETGQSGGVEIDQLTNPAPANGPFTVTVSANPSTIPADGKSTSTITVTVKDKNGSAVSGDPIQLSLSASPNGACGSLSASTGTTNASGQLVVTYTTSSTVGFCTISAQEANTGASSSALITQTG